MGSGLEAPVVERGQTLAVDLGPEALQHGFLHDFSPLVNRDFNDLVARGSGQLPGKHNRIGSLYGQRGPELITVELTPSQRSVGKAGLDSVPRSGERLRRCIVMLFGWRERQRFSELRDLWRVEGQRFVAEALMTIPFRRTVRGTVPALVGRLGRPVQSRDRCSVVAHRDRHRIEQKRFGLVQEKGENRSVKRNRAPEQPALPRRGRRA